MISEQPNNSGIELPDTVMPQCPSRNLLRGQKALVSPARIEVQRFEGIRYHLIFSTLII